MYGVHYLEQQSHTIAEQPNYRSLMERVGAENTDSIIVTIFKPLQIRLYDALPS